MNSTHKAVVISIDTSASVVANATLLDVTIDAVTYSVSVAGGVAANVAALELEIINQLTAAIGSDYGVLVDTDIHIITGGGAVDPTVTVTATNVVSAHETTLDVSIPVELGYVTSHITAQTDRAIQAIEQARNINAGVSGAGLIANAFALRRD